MADDGDKSDLRELSQCLSQASSLINAILKQPEDRSSSSQSTRPERAASSAQNERLFLFNVISFYVSLLTKL